MRRATGIVLVVGAALLVAGVVVFALGHGKASTAEDDLTRAGRDLLEQRAATEQARTEERKLGEQAKRVIDGARALLASADEVGTLDSELVASARDARQAGAAAQVDAYNAAVDRGNAAVEQFNTLTAALNDRLNEFTAAIAELDIEQPEFA